MKNLVTRASLMTVALSLLCLAPAIAEDKNTTVEIGEIKLEVPSTWKKEKPSNRLRLAQFRIPGEEGDEEGAELTVFAFGAQGVQANIDRWIGQFSSTDRKVKVTKGEAKLGEYYFVNISGTFNKPVGPPIQRKTKPTPNSRVINVMLNVKDKGPYFFKLTGTNATVQAHADALRIAFGGNKKKEKEVE